MARTLLVIDSLGSGGAQRQMVNLALGLKKRGFDVELFIYHPEDKFFFQALLDKNINVVEYDRRMVTPFRLALQLCREINLRKKEVVISFMDGPNMLSGFSRLLNFGRFTLIASERTNSLADRSRFQRLVKVSVHSLSSKVVSNSHAEGRWLKSFFWLRRKVKVIPNGYELPDKARSVKGLRKGLCVLVVGRIHTSKNGLNICKAVTRFHKKMGWAPEIFWVGRQEKDLGSIKMRHEMDTVIKGDSEVAARWNWEGEQRDVKSYLNTADVLVHASHFEGMPNAICEALCAGVPVIASDVGDNHMLIEQGVTGFLCNPDSDASICEALENFVTQSQAARQVMSESAFKFAKANLSVEKMVDAYQFLIEQCSDSGGF